MSRTVKRGEHNSKPIKPRAFVSLKNRNLLAALRVQQDPDYYIDETYYPERYQPVHDHQPA